MFDTGLRARAEALVYTVGLVESRIQAAGEAGLTDGGQKPYTRRDGKRSNKVV